MFVIFYIIVRTHDTEIIPTVGTCTKKEKKNSAIMLFECIYKDLEVVTADPTILLSPLVKNYPILNSIKLI